MAVHGRALPGGRLRGIALTALLGCALCGAALPADASAVRAHRAAPRHSLQRSRELWATIDVCGPADQPNTVGIRGSMPGDGHARDVMYMRFQLQYLQAASHTWVDLHGGASGFIKIGSAGIARQGGWSAQLMLAKGVPAYTMRGLVSFQWRNGHTVVHRATRTTAAGHHSTADADPRGYSAAQCTIG